MDINNIIYDYKQKVKKNENSFVSIRDKGENALLEVEKKGNKVEMVIRNPYNTAGFTIPLELFEKMYKDIFQDNNK